MTVIGFLANGLLLFAALGGANIMLGRCYWPRPRLAQIITGSITAIVMIGPTAYALYICVPDLVNPQHLLSPVNGILATMVFALVASTYGYFFKLGDRHGRYIPDPNRTELEDDLPPMPAK